MLMNAMNDDMKQAAGWNETLAIHRHVEAQSCDSTWVDEALSDYVFNSNNPGLEDTYRCAIFNIHHRDNCDLMKKLINDALWEKAKSEIENYEPDYDAAA